MYDLLDAPLPGEVMAGIAQRMAKRRKEHGMTQSGLAEKSGVSLGSIRRFEQLHEISLNALVSIAFALGCEQDFDVLFSHPYYRSIDDAVAATRHD